MKYNAAKILKCRWFGSYCAFPQVTSVCQSSSQRSFCAYDLVLKGYSQYHQVFGDLCQYLSWNWSEVTLLQTICGCLVIFIFKTWRLIIVAQWLRTDTWVSFLFRRNYSILQWHFCAVSRIWEKPNLSGIYHTKKGQLNASVAVLSFFLYFVKKPFFTLRDFLHY